MAGTLTIATLSDGTNSTSSTNCIQGSAKAWVNFTWTGSAISIKSSYNTSSVTRSSTGQYVVNFTNAMPNTNYFPVVTNNGSTGTTPTPSGAALIGTGFQTNTLTTTSITVVNLYYSAVAYDVAQNGVAIFSS